MSIKKKETWSYILLLALSATCVVFNKYPIFSWLSLLLLLILYLRLAITKISFLVKYFPLVFSSALFIAGVSFCEFTHIELYEIDSVAHFAGSIPAAVLLYFVFFFFLLIFDKPIKNISKSQFLNRINKLKYSNLNHYIAMASSLVLLLMFARIARYPAFLMGVDRFVYASTYGRSNGIWRIFESISYALIVFPLLDLINGHKLTGLFGLLCYVLFYLWNGNKFGPFYTLLVVYFIVDYERFAFISKRKVHRFLIVTGITVIVLVGIAAIIQSSVMNISIIDYVSNRASQQGQLWWATFLKANF